MLDVIAALRGEAEALRRAGKPGYPGYQAACAIVADDLDLLADQLNQSYER